MNDTYNTTVQTIKESAGSLATAYLQSAEQVAKSGSEVAGSYQKIAETLQGENTIIEQSGRDHEQHLEALNKNLTALNAVYELQVKEGSDHLKGTQKVYAGIEDMIAKLKDSIDETSRYKEEVVKLRDNLSSLNNIYGNMLSAMNVIINK
jgi:gliding motility-associated protein GldL